ncbi:MAG: ferredoxin [bacterium]|nr:ferredoxin [bacterium]MCP5067645.1 ferredoxin [bacterium]
MALAKFEVAEDDCIGCSLCPERAPENMEMIPGGSVARVTLQPANKDQEQACYEAAEYCPIGALEVCSE